MTDWLEWFCGSGLTVPQWLGSYMGGKFQNLIFPLKGQGEPVLGNFPALNQSRPRQALIANNNITTLTDNHPPAMQFSYTLDDITPRKAGVIILWFFSHVSVYIYIYTKRALKTHSDQSSIYPYHYLRFSISDFHFLYDSPRMWQTEEDAGRSEWPKSDWIPV